MYLTISSRGRVLHKVNFYMRYPRAFTGIRDVIAPLHQYSSFKANQEFNLIPLIQAQCEGVAWRDGRPEADRHSSYISVYDDRKFKLQEINLI